MTREEIRLQVAISVIQGVLEAKHGVIGELEDLRDETQERLDNMPESLQESDTGQLLQERIDECDNLINEFECIDTAPDYDDDASEEEIDEWWEGKVQEVKDVCFNL